MKKTHILFPSILIILAVLVVACSSGAEPVAEQPGEETPQEEPPAEDADCSSDELFCVGVVTDVGEIDDKSFNQAAWNGAEMAEQELGAAIQYVETQDAKDYANNIELFAQDNYDVVVTTGFALGQATEEAAVAYPDIDFIGIDQFPSENAPPNYTGLVFPEDKGGFRAGALAAMLTESGTIAGVFGTDVIPAVVAYKEGFENGARYINPDLNIISSYHPGGLEVAFADPEWGATTARQAVDQGADVLFGAGGKTSNGALQEVASVDGAYCIGVDLDQWLTLPEAHPCLVSSAMKLIVPGVFDLTKLSYEGNFPGGLFVGATGMAPFHDFDDQIPQEVKDKMAEIDASLEDGSIETGYVFGE